EPLLTLAVAAALTTRVRLMTEVLISLVRNTTILAKESATLDLLSRGRLTPGIGPGGWEDDYLETGMPYEHRGKRLDEQLEQMAHPGRATDVPQRGADWTPACSAAWTRAAAWWVHRRDDPTRCAPGRWHHCRDQRGATN
ncbi:MAG: LLM class flavin-dependent oxidoreductase, partial [Ktedonobacteraceae bacterium]|nr:LLM class flavin-dependent oxidoreductase [Ktedonobacteraceae bacterium]